jgi:ankyrin
MPDSDDSDSDVEIVPRVAPRSSALAHLVDSLLQTDSEGGRNSTNRPHFPGVTERTETVRGGMRGEDKGPGGILGHLLQLRKSVMEGDIPGTKARVRTERGARIVSSSIASASPLVLASYKGSASLVRTLLHKGAAVDGKSEDGLSALFLASQKGHVEVCRALIEYGADVNASIPTQRNETPLTSACQSGLTEVAKLLVAAGADLEKPIDDGSSPFLLCVYIGCRDSEKESFPKHLACARFLLESGAVPDTQDENGFTPLLCAIIQNCVPMAELLLEHNADPNINPAGRRGPLELSASMGYTPLVRLLLKHGANPTTPNERMWTPLHVAMQADDESSIVEITEMLLSTKAVDINACEENGATPLYLAVQQRRSDVAAILLRAGAIPDICTNSDVSPLERAVAHADHECIDVLLRHGADVKRVDHNGRGILHAAATVKDASVTALLIERGAEVDLAATEEDNKIRPLQIAVFRGHEEVVAMLLEHGAAP